MTKLILHDLQSEKIVLTNMVKNKEFTKSVVMLGLLVEDHFADLFNRDVFRACFDFYKRFGSTPDERKLKTAMKDYITHTKAFSDPKAQLDVWVKGVARFFESSSKITPEEFNSDISILEELRKARLMQRTIVLASEMFEKAEYDKGFTKMSESILESKRVESHIEEGDIVEDLDEHLMLLQLQRSGQIKVNRSGIYGYNKVHDDDSKLGSADVIEMDKILGGGFYPKEMTVLIGPTGVGKSFFLMEALYNSARLDKANVVMFTIEMNKIKQQRRVYSRLTGIPYHKFRAGTLTDEDVELLKKRIDKFEKTCGKFKVVAFDKGATVQDIETKMKDIEAQWFGQHKIDLIAIDYLNDMTPVGKFLSDKSWDALGSISWGLAQLSKYWDNHRGIHIITANQKRGDDPTKKVLDWYDAGFSKMVIHHASIGIGVTMEKLEDHGVNRLLWHVFKSRDSEKWHQFYTFPDYSISRIFSVKKAQQYYNYEENHA